jgi:hypothetical protein
MATIGHPQAGRGVHMATGGWAIGVAVMPPRPARIRSIRAWFIRSIPCVHSKICSNRTPNAQREVAAQQDVFCCSAIQKAFQAKKSPLMKAGRIYFLGGE